MTSPLSNATMKERIRNYQVEANDIIILIVNSISCPFTVVLNLMVIMAVKRRRRLQTNSNILLACLAATDTLTGLITQPAFILWRTFEMTGVIVYSAAYTIHVNAIGVLSVCSCLHLMLVTSERLVAIKFTMHYPYTYIHTYFIDFPKGLFKDIYILLQHIYCYILLQQKILR